MGLRRPASGATGPLLSALHLVSGADPTFSTQRPARRPLVFDERWEASLDAELVAFWVLHDDEVLAFPQYGGAESLEASYLFGDPAGCPQVEVLAVLGRLRLRDTLEPDVRPAPAWGLHVRLLACRVLVDGGAQCAGPELRERQGIPAVERDALDEGDHPGILSAGGLSRHCDPHALVPTAPITRVDGCTGARVRLAAVGVAQDRLGSPLGSRLLRRAHHRRAGGRT